VRPTDPRGIQYGHQIGGEALRGVWRYIGLVARARAPQVDQHNLVMGTEVRNDAVPHVVVAGLAVDQQQRVAGANKLVEQSGAIFGVSPSHVAPTWDRSEENASVGVELSHMKRIDDLAVPVNRDFA
jgi:hypothetical protein